MSERDVTEYLSSADVRELAGISERQLDFWTTQGLLRPDHEGGTGYARRWPPEEAAIAARMGRLVAAGFSPAKAAEFARNGWPEGEIGAGIRLTVAEDTP